MECGERGARRSIAPDVSSNHFRAAAPVDGNAAREANVFMSLLSRPRLAPRDRLSFPGLLLPSWPAVGILDGQNCGLPLRLTLRPGCRCAAAGWLFLGFPGAPAHRAALLLKARRRLSSAATLKSAVFYPNPAGARARSRKRPITCTSRTM
jgi:hypothetical protein